MPSPIQNSEAEQAVSMPVSEFTSTKLAKNPRKRKKKTAFIYGNYPFYYGYRVGRTMDEDLRVSVFRREWIENKDCLDIGCNEGHVTIAVAVRFCCKSMLGVDIDSKLIQKARSNLRLESEEAPKGELLVTEIDRENSSEKAAHVVEKRNCEAFQEAPNDESLDLVSAGKWEILEENRPNAENKDSAEQCNESEKRLSISELLGRITFKTQNYIEGRVCVEKYDTIVCLSVSKWIHLNWGDQGLISFFSKIYQELRPGGILVLEPQPWKSYSKKRRVSEVARKHFTEALLRPDEFPSILTEKIGFKSFEQVSSEMPNSKTGFRRPLFVYYK